MPFRVYFVFDDASRDLQNECDDLDEAAAHALKLADDAGKRPLADGETSPLKVDVYRDERLELSILISRGGLVPGRGSPGSRST